MRDLQPVLDGIQPFLPEGKVVQHSSKPGSPGGPLKHVDLQIETTLDETPQTRFAGTVIIDILALESVAAARERLAFRLSASEALFERGGVDDSDPGDLCYRASDKGFGESEIFIRGNVNVELHCWQPERTNASPLCGSLVTNLGARIDGLIQSGLGRP